MKFLPVFLKLADRNCLVVGGGPVAARKVRLLVGANARVQVISPGLCREMNELSSSDKVQVFNREFSEADIDNQALIFAATNQPEVNLLIARLADEHKIPCNVVDDPDNGTFIMPSIIDRSPVIAAVSTGGTSPVLARLIKSKLESIIPSSYGKLAEIAGTRLKKHLKTLLTENIFGIKHCRADLPNAYFLATLKKLKLFWKKN